MFSYIASLILHRNVNVISRAPHTSNMSFGSLRVPRGDVDFVGENKGKNGSRRGFYSVTNRLLTATKLPPFVNMRGKIYNCSKHAWLWDFLCVLMEQRLGKSLEICSEIMLC